MVEIGAGKDNRRHIEPDKTCNSVRSGRQKDSIVVLCASAPLPHSKAAAGIVNGIAMLPVSTDRGSQGKTEDVRCA